MFKSTLQPEKIHGLVFDGAMFLGNLAFIRYVPMLGDDVEETTAGGLLLLAVLTQFAGAWWKKGYLGQRLTTRVHQPVNRLANGFMTLLLLFHFILFSVITVLALALLGIYQIEGSESFLRGDIWILIAFVVGGITTGTVWRAGQPAKDAEARQTRPRWFEFGADALLWVSVSLVTRIFWDSLVALIEPSAGIGLVATGIVLLLAMFALYVFFYLPGRYLFLVEDYQSPLTWVQVFLAMLPVVSFVIFG